MIKIFVVILSTTFAIQALAETDNNEFLKNYVIVEERKSVSEEDHTVEKESNINYENIETRSNQSSIVEEEIDNDEIKQVESISIETIAITEKKDLQPVLESENVKIINTTQPDFNLDVKNNNIENQIIDEVDVLLNETTAKISNETVNEEVDNKVNDDYNKIILEKIKDLERRVSELEKIKKPEEI